MLAKLSGHICRAQYAFQGKYASEAFRAHMLVLRTSNSRLSTIRPIAPRHDNSSVFIVHL